MGECEFAFFMQNAPKPAERKVKLQKAAHFLALFFVKPFNGFLPPAVVKSTYQNVQITQLPGYGQHVLATGAVMTQWGVFNGQLAKNRWHCCRRKAEKEKKYIWPKSWTKPGRCIIVATLSAESKGEFVLFFQLAAIKLNSNIETICCPAGCGMGIVVHKARPLGDFRFSLAPIAPRTDRLWFIDFECSFSCQKLTAAHTLQCPHTKMFKYYKKLASRKSNKNCFDFHSVFGSKDSLSVPEFW